jgi:carbamoylphosphate synthase large subunit
MTMAALRATAKTFRDGIPVFIKTPFGEGGSAGTVKRGRFGEDGEARAKFADDKLRRER